jgi:light-independent protochlorophyllide reductase subunit B
MMGLEEHLLGMFREDFEFNGATSSHLAAAPAADPVPEIAADNVTALWAAEAENELKKIPFFVRGKVRRNTERFAADRHVARITLETLYEAKAHFSGVAA